ncbi:hypothetical protein [Maritalea sp.]|uniref:hypothetical protein n=1 Tax=Maritalea sp. TaxID=2003361 RepID=UPI003EF9572B
MNRIHITGNAGSGKTTFAAELGLALGLPVFGLDSIVWQPGWQKTPTAERVIEEEALISQKIWIIEGVSKPVRDAADVLYFWMLFPAFPYGAVQNAIGNICLVGGLNCLTIALKF